MPSYMLEPHMECQAEFCDNYTVIRGVHEPRRFKTWREAKKAAIAHNKETGHLVRVEHIRTILIGWEDA